MFASVTAFRGQYMDLDGAAKAAGESMEGWLREFDGYLGLLILTNQESGSAYALTFWESEEAAEQSRPGRARMREQMAATIGIELVSNEHHSISYRDGPRFD